MPPRARPTRARCSRWSPASRRTAAISTRSTAMRRPRRSRHALAGTGGVRYLDRGWQQLVDALAAVAVEAGVRRARGREGRRGGAHGPRACSCAPRRASIRRTRWCWPSGGPATINTAARRCEQAPWRRWAIEEQPVLAAALDLGLSHLPEPDHGSCSVSTTRSTSRCTRRRPRWHRAAATSCTCSGTATPTDDPRTRLEALMDRAQPGWRDVVVAERYGRRLVVSHGRPRPGSATRVVRSARCPIFPVCTWPATGWDRLGCSPTRHSRAGRRPARRLPSPREPPSRHDRRDMTAPGPDSSREFEALRPRLFGIAYRMTGSVADAEDLCQEAWVRWSALDAETVREPEAYLVRTISNLSIDRLRSAQHRREAYVGPSLPEPLVEQIAGVRDLRRSVPNAPPSSPTRSRSRSSCCSTSSHPSSARCCSSTTCSATRSRRWPARSTGSRMRAGRSPAGPDASSRAIAIPKICVAADPTRSSAWSCS